MFTKIFTYEIKHWLKQPSTYVYAVIFFLFGFGAMAVSADILGEVSVERGSKAFVNSSFNVISLFFDFNLFILFVIPALIGGSVFRDYNSNMFMVLYSYPIRKKDYLLGKFLSSLLITTVIVLLIGFGLFLGSILPGLNPSLVGNNSIMIYATPYLLIVLPNVLIVSMIVFSVILYSRNIYAGFIAVLLIYITRRMILFVLGGTDNQFISALVDPFAQVSAFYYIRYWTLEQMNSLIVPINEIIVYNRLIWLGFASAIFAWSYKRFQLAQHIKGFSFLTSNKSQPDSKRANISNRSRITPVKASYTFVNHLQTTWKISNYEFKAIMKSKAFISLFIGSLVFMFFLLGQVNPQYTTRIQPLTQVMLLIPSMFYSFLIVLITFLYSGVLVHRDRNARLNQLIDVSPLPTWSFMLSKFLTLIKMQIVLLSVIMIVGIGMQAYRGYYDFEVPLYLFEIYGITLITLVIWAAISLFVQTILPNQYIGLLLLIIFSIGLGGLEKIGIKLDIFNFNSAPRPEYSDISGYGSSLAPYFIHKIYWFFFAIILLIGTQLFWARGLTQSFKDRIALIARRFSRQVALILSLTIVAFITTGFVIYQVVYPEKPALSVLEMEQYKAEIEAQYSPFKSAVQPRLSGISMNMNLFPNERNYTSNGTLLFVNKSNQEIDTLLISYSNEENTSYTIPMAHEVVYVDSILGFDILKLRSALTPGDSIYIGFEAFNTPSTFFKANSQVANNGTFLFSSFPMLGYPEFEIKSPSKRDQYGLSPQPQTILHPSDSSALVNTYVGNNVDLMDFEVVVSTSADQIAIASGQLERKWIDGNRAYFHYSSTNKIRNGIVFQSGKFEILKDTWNDVDLEIYYHKTHDFNLDRMMAGMKSTLEYSTKHFGPYQFKQMRIVEFPTPYGKFAQSFASMIPFSEFAGFISKIDTVSKNRFDSPFRLTSHEMAHQWWGHQVVPAGVLGSRIVSEGLAEYTSLKVLEKEYGKEKMQIYLKGSLDQYLRGRGQGKRPETPMIYSKASEVHINYSKAALVYYTMSEYIGEDSFNEALQNFFQAFSLKENPYSTSLDLVESIRNVTPDSLQYLITDLFETATLYDNSVRKVIITPLEDGLFEVDIDFLVSKYRSGEYGKRSFDTNNTETYEYQNGDEKVSLTSLPLQDYIEIGIFGDNGEILYMKKHKVSSIENSVSILVKKKPAEIAIDPYNTLIDADSKNNRKSF